MISYIPVDFNPFAEELEIEKVAFTNESQREIWLSCVIGGDGANLSYNESVSLVITGNFKFIAFQKALEQLILRHEALRATISPNGETLIIYKDVPVTLLLVDIRDLDEAATRVAFNAFLKKEMILPLDLSAGPLFKAFLHKTGEHEHYFTIIRHHIIGDGWSTGIMLEDLGRMYNAYAKGQDISLEPASQISDYASAQAAFKRSAAYRETEEYWLDIYKESVPVLDVPTDYPRPASKTYNGNRIDFPVTKETVDQLKAIGARQGCSLVTTLLAAFEVFLYQLTMQDDIVVGLPSSGQAATGLTNVVGHCVNLLPLRTHIDAPLSFSSYLRKRKKEVLDAYDHQRITFGELIKKLYIPRDTSRIPLVPVMFNIDMGMDNAVAFDGLSFKLISNPRSYENFEIYLNATGSKDGIVLEWSYNTDLFDYETVVRFNERYNTIINKVIADPAILISDLTGIVEAAAIDSSKEIYLPDGLTINTLIDDTIRKYKDKTAVTFESESLTYARLGEKTNQLAAFLIQNGIASGDIVALSLDRSIEMLVCLLAILKVNAVYLPLDPEYPADRIGFMLKDSSAKLLITSGAYRKKYNETVNEVLIEEIWPLLAKSSLLSEIPNTNGSDLAYVLYTSGSTGKPKGVKVTHRNLVNFLVSMQAAPGITDHDRLLAITSISFDIAALELYLPLISGAELIVASNAATKDGRLLLEILQDKSITMMQATPSTWQMLLDSGWDKRYDLKMLSGGESLPVPLAENLLAHGTELWNMYGPTETTIWSTIKKIVPGEKLITVGLPINNTRIYIIDETGRQVKAGKPGEIYIGGEGVAAGYLNNAALTAEKFVPDSYSKKPDARLYRTGDLGRKLASGEVECLGRLDHQVKIRGHRIELGEIEAAMALQEGIKQVVVIATEGSPVSKRLVAYLTLTGDADANGAPSWKDRWDTLYETGAENRQKQGSEKANIDGTLLESLENSEELSLQLDEWLHTTVVRVKEINSRNIYEIGCGAGQVLFELAPGMERYIATDYAQAAIDNINERLTAEPLKWKHVSAGVATADDFSFVGNTKIDLVLINSVAQYFPGTEYMINVIRGAVGLLKEGGCLFIGDMQGMGSLEMYHAMDHLSRASGTATMQQFRDVVRNRVRIEEEFVADPAFFYLLPKLIPGITGIDTQLREGQYANETTKYHYDVWIYVSVPVEVVEPQVRKDWANVQAVEQLEQLLDINRGSSVAVEGITNSRTVKDHKLLELLHSGEPGKLIGAARLEVEQTAGGYHPDVFRQIGRKYGYKAHVRWATDGTDGKFDVVFIPVSQKIWVPAFSIRETGKDIYDYARTPAYNNNIALSADLIGKWKNNLNPSLPAYMVPDDFVALRKLPLTPNAKIDRKKLSMLPLNRESTKANDSRRLTENEQLIAAIWRDVLGLSDVNPTDDFFQLGGHSLLAVKVMVAIEKKTGKRLPIATLFNNATIEKLAAQLSDELPAEKWAVLVPIKTTGNKRPLFLIHGGGLNILLFKSITEYFGADQPIYGIQALGLNHETNIPASIQEIAALYVDDMIRVDPDGPYAIAGYSLGGFLAFEMARHLIAKGKEISFLGVMDTYAGNNYYVGSNMTRAAKKISRQFHKLSFFAKSFASTPKEAFEYQVIVAKKRLEKLKTDGPLIPENTFNEYEAGLYRKYSDALDAYVLTPLDVAITLFRVEKRLYFLDDLVHLGWGSFALKGVKVCEVPGDHKTFLFPPNSRQFAHIMQSELDRAAKTGLRPSGSNS